jgi:O-antigen/teichoic acid export membrane protein
MSWMPSSAVDASAREMAGSAMGGDVSALWPSPARLRVWGVRSAASLVDQALTSGVGLAVNLLLARWMTASLYGAFAVTFAGFLFFAGFHNVLLLEPLSVIGPARYGDGLRAYFRTQLTLHIVLVGALSLLGLLAGAALWRVLPASPLVGPVLGGALMLPFLLLLWLVRRMCYVLQRPAAAVAGSAFYIVFVIAGMLALRAAGTISGFSAFLLMGIGAFLASGVVVFQLRAMLRGAPQDARLRWQSVLRENWTYGRWLVGSTVLYSASNQIQIFLLPAFLGLGAAGILRAMQLPSLVMTQAITATGLLVLPSLACDFGLGAITRMRHKVVLTSCALAGLAVFFALLLLFLAGPTERLLFGGKFAGFAWLIPVLALGPAVTAMSMGCSMALRASQKPHFDLIANAIAAPIGLLTAICFMRWWGIGGAAVSMVVSFAAASVVACLSYRFVFAKKIHESAV